MDISVLIVNYNTASLLPEAIAALRRASTNLSLETILVDNASRDDSVELIRRDFADIRLIVNSTNVGFGRANNQALELATGRYLLLLNTDAFVAPDTLTKTMAYMDANPKCGILGVKLTDRDGRIQPSARYFPTPWNLFLQRTGLKRFVRGVRMVDEMDWDHASVRQCDWVPGCYYMVRKEVINLVGLFDPRFFLYYEEVDHCLATKTAGWDVVFYPGTSVVHIGGESAKSESAITQSGRQIDALRIESELLYFRKNGGVARVWANVLLTVLGSAFNSLKRLMSPKSPTSPDGFAQQVRLVSSIFRRTGWGTRATR